MYFKNEALSRPLQGDQTGKAPLQRCSKCPQRLLTNVHTAVRELLCFGSPKHKFFHAECCLPLWLAGGEKTKSNNNRTRSHGCCIQRIVCREVGQAFWFSLRRKKTDLSDDTEAATQIMFNTAASYVFRSQPYINIAYFQSYYTVHV